MIRLEKMDAKLISTLELDYHDVSIGGSLGENLGSCPRQVGGEEFDDLSACEQPSLPVESFVKGDNERLDCEPGSSVHEHLEHSSTNNLHEVGSNMEGVEDMQELVANAEVVGSLDDEVDQGLVSDSVKPQSEEEIDAGQVQDEECVDLFAYEQPSLLDESYVKGNDERLEEHGPASLVPEHLGRKPTGDLHEVVSNMEGVQEVQGQRANAEVVSSLHEEVDRKLVSVLPKPQSKEEMNIRQVGGEECDDLSNYEQPSLLDKSYVEGDDERLEYEPVSSVPEHLEHKPTDDLHEVGLNIDDGQEVRGQSANAEAVGSPDEVDQELVNDSAKPRSKEEVNVRQVGVEECNNQSVFEQPSLPDEPIVKGNDEKLVCEPGSLAPEHLDLRGANDPHDVVSNVKGVEGMHVQAANLELVGSPDEQQVDQELVPDSAKPQSKEEKSAKRTSPKPGSLIKDDRVRYQLPAENEGEFAVFDLVWGKVKSHPWWPGQIFHPSDSSEKAMKYYKKDCYLVAYFGDRTFAWNDASVLKPFMTHFPQAERQNSSEAFQNAVRCALEEVTRRVVLGLACSCVSEPTYDKIKYQIVENSGIREESSKREGVDRSTGADSFQPDKLVEYVRTLALFPTSGFDRLDLVVAKAQLLAFNQLKGCDALPEFQYYEGLVEYYADIPHASQGLLDDNEPTTGVNGKKGPHKRKHNLKDIVYHRRKEKSMTDLMGETMYYFDGEFDSHEEDDIFSTSPIAGSKRKASGFLSDDFTAPQSTKTISLAKVSHKASPNPQKSFKVGECIRRVASQMTGSSIIVKDCSEGSNNKHLQDDADEVLEPLQDNSTESTPIPSKQSSLDEMLSQLRLCAQNPKKGYSTFGEIISFFTEFRNSAVTTQRQKMRKGSCRKKKASVPAVGSSENFEFDDRNDSYWTDMVVQDNPEAKPARRGRKRKDERAFSGDHEKPVQRKPRKNSRKQYHNDNHEPVPVMPTVDEKQLDLPTELLLNFGEMGSLPSEVNLNKMFKRFGPLKESETEVDMQSSRARVVFKKRSDAEVAYSSAAMFNIFGSTLVNYELNYTPIVSFRNPPLELTNGKENAI